MTTTQDKIREFVNSHDVVLFMKGSPAMPQCGFSATVSKVLTDLGVPFVALDVLADPALRAGIKEFSNWPTIPQLYVKGGFVGGCDIVTEMSRTGELVELFAQHDIQLAS